MRKYLKNLWTFLGTSRQYIKPILLFHILVIALVTPALIALTNRILANEHINTISVDDVINILTKHIWTTIALILVVIIMLIFVYIEFSFLVFLAYFVARHQSVTFRQLMFLAVGRLKRVRIPTICFFIAYFLVILPLSGFAGNLDFISRIRIPSFIMSVVITGPWLFKIIYLLVTLVSIYLAWRWILVLPLIILQKLRLRYALKQSWQLTRGRFWGFFWQFLLLVTVLVAIFMALSTALVAIQGYVDTHFAHLALASAIINLSLVQLVSMIQLVLLLVLIFFVIIQILDEQAALPETIKIPSFRRFRILARIFGWIVTVLVLVLIVFATLLENYLYLQPKQLAQPMLISHRGLTNNHGVQNTIPALKFTSEKYHPDYVEMDIRQSKDKKFVVMHDDNLQTLAHKNWTVESKNYRDLVNLPLSENGHHAKLPGFTEYFNTADKLHQKLLIEIKVTQGQNAKAVTDNFIKQYGQQVVANKAMIHSLSLEVTKEARKQLPKTTTSYIMPFNILGVPMISANAFSMEVSSLDESFVFDAQDQNKQVFAWDVDDADTVQRMRIYGVDALISDDMPLVKDMVINDPQNLTYAQKLRIHIRDMNNRVLNSFLNTNWQDRDV